MARIAYSMSGEGRGHATRVRAMVEMLRTSHDLVLYAPGNAHELLVEAYAGTGVEVRELPCLRFAYGSSGQVDRLRTLAGAVPFVRRLSALSARLAGDLWRERFDLVVTDFEPALPRAARRCGVPVISLDHQHVLVEGNLGFLPARLRWHAAVMGLAVRAFVPHPDATIVSSFHHPPARRPREGVRHVGVLLRPELLRTLPRRGVHLTAYLRRAAPDSLLDVLAATGRPVQVFGLGARAPRGALRFEAVNESAFVSSLASAAALVTTAGNQVVGEAIFLGKPVLAIPEPGNAEQEINAHLLAASGAGVWVPMGEVDEPCLAAFDRRLDELERRCLQLAPNGNAVALAAVLRHLPQRSAPMRRPRALPAPLRPAPLGSRP